MDNYIAPQKGRMALLTIDLQQDYCRSDTPLGSSAAEGILPAVVEILACFRAVQAPIYHGIRLYKPDGSNVDACRRKAVEEGMRILMPGSLGAELVAAAKPDRSLRLDPRLLLRGGFQPLGSREWAFYKPRWGCFFGTELEAELRRQAITTVAMVGFDFCGGVRATVYEASDRDFRIVAFPDAIAGGEEREMNELGRLGVHLIAAKQCRRWLSGSPPPSHAAA